MAAGRLHGACQSVGVEVAGAFENHVLEEMGDPGAKVRVLVHAAGGHPDLRANHGRGGVRIEDQGEAVGEGFDSGGGSGVFHEVLA